MPFNLGLPELALIVIAALLIYGPKRLPELGRMLGQFVRDFRNGLSIPTNAETASKQD